MSTIQKIFPCLWFDGQAEEAAAFYVSVFERSRITQVTRYPDEGKEVHGHEAGSVMVVRFELEGVPFTALNGGPKFKFTEAISLQVQCDTQDELDRYWGKLTAGGDERAQQCGWLKDRYGLSWQLVPTEMPALMGSADPVKAARVMRAMLPMKKLDLAALKKAYEG